MNDSYAAAEPTAAEEGTTLFRRSEHALSHIVYGLILALAALGELINHEASAGEAALALFGTGIVLLAAHSFADVLARLVATSGDVGFLGVVRIGRHDLAVALGGFVMGAVMLLADLADADADRAMVVCLVGALGWLALNTFYALRDHRLALRLPMTVAAVLLAGIIVTLENLH
jgi:hypothetical protein